MQKTESILFTTILRPIKPYGKGWDPLDLFGSRLTVGQGIFTFNHFSPNLGLHYIASNLLTPATVLEYPSDSELQAELSRGYGIVGVAFTNTSVEDAFAVCRLIRKQSPRSRIILGGYGVQCLNQYLAQAPGAEGLFDDVCREEGVGFMRRYLGEPADRPVQSDLPPQLIYPLGARFAARPAGALIQAFGCNNRCPFCSTSAFYNHHRIDMMEPAQMAEQVRCYLRKYPGMEYLAVFCENFLSDPAYLQEVNRLLAPYPECRPGRFSFSCMSSIETLSGYEADELAAWGIGNIWIGVESSYSTLPKRQGRDPVSCFRALHQAGIQTTGSFMIGQDEQSPANIEADIACFIALEPTLTQVSTLVPGPGVELWDQLQSEGRLRLRSWGDQHIYTEAFAFKNFRPGEVLHWVDETISRLYLTLGPSLLRSMKVWCSGYERFCRSRDERLRLRADHYAKQLKDSRVTLDGIIKYAPSLKVQQDARDIKAQAHRLVGKPSAGDWIMTQAINGWLLKNRITRHGAPGTIRQPRLIVKRYRQG